MEQENKIIELEKQLQIARSELSNIRRQMATLKNVHLKTCDEINSRLNSFKCNSCLELEKSKQDKEYLNDNIPINFIGEIDTDFPEKRGTPRQPSICPSATGKINLNYSTFTNPNHALEGLNSFSHMWIIFYFHKNNSAHIQAKVAPPRLNGEKLGVFATRSPHRPNPLGLSLVKIDLIGDNCIYFSGVDMIDKTPVVDIKPYIPKYDSPYNTHDTIDINYPIYKDLSNTNDIRTLVGEENSENNLLLNPSHGPGDESINKTMEELYLNQSEMGERQAPDGEEQDRPPQASKKIHVPKWIDKPNVSRKTVVFKDKALEQLSQFTTNVEEKKRILIDILQEDPRSVYLREKWSSHCYVFRIKDMCVSCKFDDASHTVTVYQIFQNTFTESNESQ